MSVAIITQPYKKINWRRDGVKPFLGHRYWREKYGTIDGDKRCLICGKWFTWSEKHKDRYIREGRWDFRRNEPIHCGSSMCEEYWRRYKKAEKIRAELKKEFYFNLFKKLKKIGLVK